MNSQINKRRKMLLLCFMTIMLSLWIWFFSLGEETLLSSCCCCCYYYWYFYHYCYCLHCFCCCYYYCCYCCLWQCCCCSWVILKGGDGASSYLIIGRASIKTPLLLLPNTCLSFYGNNRKKLEKQTIHLKDSFCWGVELKS